MEVDKVKVQVTPKWKRSKEEIWNADFAPLLAADDKQSHSKHRVRMAVYSLVASVAACFLVVFFYQKEVTVARGNQQAVVLPDDSRVQLNAASRLTYKPLMWFVDRTVHLEGEAYFEVSKGKRFTVQSARGAVQVLGTKFNVYTRKDGYLVSCLTGKVGVSSMNQETILTPSMEARWVKNKLVTARVEDVASSIVWTQHAFSFRHVPLPQVLNELSRRYDVKLEVDGNIHHFYTGKFPSETPISEILYAIESTFDITLKVAE